MKCLLYTEKLRGLTGEGPRVRAGDFDPYQAKHLSDSSNSDMHSDTDDVEHDPYNILGVRDT